MRLDAAKLLTGGEAPQPFRHYPAGDVYDLVSHSQFYYHVHRDGEHGHIHLFLRPLGMPPGLRPIRPTPEADAPCHLVAVALGPDGDAVELFTTNRWVTGEAWYAADDVKAMLPYFQVVAAGDHGRVGRWLTELVAQRRADIEALVDQRDAALAEWHLTHPERDPLEDQRLEILSRTAL